MPNEDVAVTNFRKYLRINTCNSSPDYDGCCQFFADLADELGIQHSTIRLSSGYPFITLTIPGKRPELKSILLYSHTDVVPVFEEHWKYDPFGAYKDENGDIYARGAQDMKCVGMQYLEAIRRHFQRGTKQFERTLHIMYAPDEEIGGYKGMNLIAETKKFEDLNVGFVFNEGLASEDDIYQVYHGERNSWWGKVTFTGNPGHVMSFVPNTALEKLHSFMNDALAFRQRWFALLDKDRTLSLGDVPTLNIPIINGGVQANVVPANFVLEFSIRVPPTTNFDELEAEIKGWVQKAGDGVELEWIGQPKNSVTTPISLDDPYWEAFVQVMQNENCKFSTSIFPAATDSKYIRSRGIRSLGFSPMINTPVLLHDHNEMLNEKVYLRGVEIYEKLIEKFGNLVNAE